MGAPRPQPGNSLARPSNRRALGIMRAGARLQSLVPALRRWLPFGAPAEEPNGSFHQPKIGLALGGGFARGIAHAGVLAAFERHAIPIHCIAGVSAGSIVAAAF